MVISVFDFDDYREFLNSWIDAQSVRGLRAQLAQALGVSSTLVSLILKGDKHLSMEQAAETVDYLGLQERETDYFFLLVEFGKAGSHKLRQKLKQKMNQQKAESKQLGKRLKKDLELSETKSAIYYSSWVYTGIRNLTALEEHNDVMSIAQRLNLPPATVHRALDFLLEGGLCKQEKGKITYGPAYTHVGQDSPFVTKHHQNWRFRGVQQMDLRNETDLFYTCPMSLSQGAEEEVRNLLLKAIQEVLKITTPSKSESVRCLSIDWFKY